MGQTLQSSLKVSSRCRGEKSYDSLLCLCAIYVTWIKTKLNTIKIKQNQDSLPRGSERKSSQNHPVQHRFHQNIHGFKARAIVHFMPPFFFYLSFLPRTLGRLQMRSPFGAFRVFLLSPCCPILCCLLSPNPSNPLSHQRSVKGAPFFSKFFMNYRMR